MRPPLHSIESRLLHDLRASALLPARSKGLLSVSGGSDSTALLFLLHRLLEPLKLELEVLHFDHGLRPESGQEAEWVSEGARRLGLEIHVRRGFLAPKSGAGIQAAARDWRREHSLALLRERGAVWIATAHQRDDHLETLLLKLLRGVHLSHIRGLDPRQGPWVRPLLGLSRAELRDYLSARGETWLEDPTNVLPKYRRNRVRHELMPLLDSLAHGGAAPRLLALERQSRALAEWIASLPRPPQSDPAQAPHWIDAQALGALPPFTRATLLHEFIHSRLPGQIDTETLEAAAERMAERESWELHIGRGRVLRQDGGRIVLERRRARPAPMAESRQGPWRVIAPTGWEVRLCEIADDQDSGHAEAIRIHNLDASLPLRVRTRTPGDRFKPAGQVRAAKLGEFLRGTGVPVWERDRLPVVVSGDEIVALYPRFVAEGHDRPAEAGASVELRIAVPEPARANSQPGETRQIAED
jgi:tRNA(Ile)-lysidine synthase